MRDPRVYIVNASGHNHHKARPYGELTPITRGYVSTGSLDRVFHEVVNGISDSNPSDWLLLSGLMFLNAIAAAIWLERHSTLQLLVWDKKHDRYREFKTDDEHLAQQWKQIHEWSEDGSGSEARSG
jgi:hypothetical protein